MASAVSSLHIGSFAHSFPQQHVPSTCRSPGTGRRRSRSRSRRRPWRASGRHLAPCVASRLWRGPCEVNSARGRSPLPVPLSPRLETGCLPPRAPRTGSGPRLPPPRQGRGVRAPPGGGRGRRGPRPGLSWTRPRTGDGTGRAGRRRRERAAGRGVSATERTLPGCGGGAQAGAGGHAEGRGGRARSCRAHPGRGSRASGTPRPPHGRSGNEGPQPRLTPLCRAAAAGGPGGSADPSPRRRLCGERTQGRRGPGQPERGPRGRRHSRALWAAARRAVGERSASARGRGGVCVGGAQRAADCSSSPSALRDIFPDLYPSCPLGE